MADAMHGGRLALPVSLELRATPSRTMAYASPLIALVLTMVFDLLLFALLGKDPVAGLCMFLVEPLVSKQTIGEVLLKTVPLVPCVLGLSVCYRTNVWNIGAEGQLILGGIFTAATIVYFDTPTLAIPGGFALVLALVAGLIGDALWAAITALLRDRFHANEVLVSLILTCIAQLLLLYVVNGPLKDPNGMNFPRSIVSDSAFVLSTLVAGTRLHVDFLLMLVMTAAMMLFVFRSPAGYRLQVGGLASQTTRYAGFSSRAALRATLLVSGGLVGVAGTFEVTGPIGQLLPPIFPGYGSAAIVVVLVGRLNPVGTVLGAIVMSLFYIGDKPAQSRLGLPSAITGVFQGMLLFFLLTCDTLIEYHLHWHVRH